MNHKQIKKAITEVAQDIADLLENITTGYRGSVEIKIKDNKVYDVKITESIEMK